MANNSVSSVNELYQNRGIYSSSDMFSPPSERLPHVIRFELTKGCSWSGCTYCEGYDGVKHMIKSMDDYREHIDEVWSRIGKRTDLARSLRRIFIGGGNALEVETEMLNEAIQYTAKKFTKNTGEHAKRISIYGRTNDILKQGEKGLEKLRYGTNGFGRFFDRSLPDGLDLIYWGVESGATDVLEYVKKGYTKDELVEAARLVNKVPIETSVMIMPGLGGKRFYDQHVKYTGEVLGIIRPRFLTFMGINPAQDSRYLKRMNQERTVEVNRPLTNKELANQMIDIIEIMPEFRTKIGCFAPNIDAVGFNPLNFGSANIFSGRDKYLFVEDLRRYSLRMFE